jgi:hypothetical protein
MTTENTPDLPAIPGSMPFVHNVDTRSRLLVARHRVGHPC